MPVYVGIINSINLLFCFSASRVPVVSIMSEKGQARGQAYRYEPWRYQPGDPLISTMQ